MNVFQLRNLLFNHRWLIDAGQIQTYLPLLSSAFTGAKVEITEDNKQPVQYHFGIGNGSPMDKPEPSEQSVAVIPLRGVMTAGGGISTYGTRDIAQMIRRAVNHESVVAIVLQIDTPGGTVDSVYHMLDAVQVAQKAGKPVVSFVERALSAGVYVASQTNRIIAMNPYVDVGSIGMMSQITDERGFLEKHGIKITTVIPPESEDKNKEIRMALDGDTSLLIKNFLSPGALQFRAAVIEGRNRVLSKRGLKFNEEKEGLLTGREFPAGELMPDLVDKIGNIDDAIQLAFDLADAGQIMQAL